MIISVTIKNLLKKSNEFALFIAILVRLSLLILSDQEGFKVFLFFKQNLTYKIVFLYFSFKRSPLSSLSLH